MTERTSWPDVGNLLAAIGLLTVLPLPRPDPKGAAFAQAAVFFPLVGLLVGLLLVALDHFVLASLPHLFRAIVLVVAWEGFSGPARGTRTLAPAAALALLKIACLSAGVVRPAVLCFAPMLAGWSIVVLATGARDLAVPAQKFNAGVTFQEFALTSVFAFAVVLTVAEAFGILIVVSVGAAALTLRLLAHRISAGVSWPFLQLSARGIEALVLLVGGLA